MGFVNEYVSEEDIQKYDLDNFINKVLGLTDEKIKMPERRLRGLHNIDWTIDREKGNWLMFMTTVYSYEGSISGMNEPTRERIFYFYWRGFHREVRLLKSPNGSINFREESPFYVIWEKLITPSPTNINNREIIHDLKCALTAYGYDGIENNAPDCIVQFEF